MGMEHVQEWADAQKITVSVDLVEAAKKQLQFLAAVDRNRFLYEGHALQRAIFRYNAFWIPLLAKHVESRLSEDPLVVPLDCEWIWHCHRLNPIKYKLDCEKRFGRVLGNHNIISTVQAPSKRATEEIWKELYPEEPYELDLNKPFARDVFENSSLTEEFTSYDLISAVKRQSSFVFQMSRPYTLDDLFLRQAAARYKGFLHLIRTNRKLNLKTFSVPSYDVDLMWHTHQLDPEAYYKDMIELVGSVVHHDDTVSDRRKGQKLDVGFSETSRHWEQAFGFSYWKAGTMYRGSVPTPVTQVPYELNMVDKGFNTFEKCGLQIKPPTVEAVEVLLEFVEIMNLPKEHKGNIFVVFTKKNPDKLCNAKRSLGISSHSEEKQVDFVTCEANGEFIFELMSFNEPISKSPKLIGSCSLSLEEIMASQSQLSTENKWVSVDLASDLRNFEQPVLLHVSISFTPPTPAPQVFQLVCSQPFKQAEFQTHVMDHDGKKVFTLQTRNIANDLRNRTPALGKEVYCITDLGEKHTLVEFHGNYLSIKGTHGSFKLQNSSGNDDSIFELVGYKMVKLFPGRRLDFEPKYREKQRPEQEFMTAVEFSADFPYGRAVALIDTKFQTIKVTNEWIVLPGIALGFILSGILRGEVQNNGFTTAKQKINNNTDTGNMVFEDGENGFYTPASECAVVNCVSECTGFTLAASICVGECDDRAGLKDLPTAKASLCISECDDRAGLKDLPTAKASLCISECDDHAGLKDLPMAKASLCVSECDDRAGLKDLPTAKASLCISECDDRAGLKDLPAAKASFCVSECVDGVNEDGNGGNCGVIVICDDFAGLKDLPTMPRMVSPIMNELVTN